MRPAAPQGGYALLAALLVTALAALFAAAAVAAVGAGLEVAAGDVSTALVSRAAGQTLDHACMWLRRRPDRLPWTAAGPASSSGVEWSWACAAVPPLEATACVQVDVVALAWSAAARRRVHAVVELRPAQGARGLAVGGDVRVRAPLTISGGGLYSGGSVAGRELVTFVDPLANGPASPGDHVHGEDWPVAAVHALGGIWAQDVEVHEAPTPHGPDTDVHTGPGPVEAVTQPPSPAGKTLLIEMADVRLAPGPDGTVDLTDVASVPSSGASGLVAVVPDWGTPVTVVGERAATDCPLVLILEGDVVLGAEGAPVRLRGALISFGGAVIAGPFSLEGHLWTRTLTVDAPAEVTTPVDWRRHPLPGLVDTAILSLGR